MAEPLILAYGRGELPEFPASPDSVVDIVPCDHVVNAILAVCATKPTIGRPEYYHVSSGARNPLTFRDLYGQIREYFLEHPFEGGPRGAARLPQWQFPGAVLGGAAAVHLGAGAHDRRAGCCDARTAVGADPQVRQRPGPDPRPARLPAPLPLALQRVRPVRAALRRRQHLRPDRVAAPRRPADLRLRHRRLRLDAPTSRTCTAPRSPHRCDGWTRCGADAATGRRTHEGPEPGHRGLDRAGRLRPGRHDHVHQRDRAVPVVAAAGAVDGRGRSPSSARCCRSCRPTCGPSGATGAPSCGRSTAATRGADLAALEAFVDTELAPTDPQPAVAGGRSAGSASTGPPDTPRCLITGVVRPLTRPLQPLFDVVDGGRPGHRRRRPLHRLPHRPAAGRGVPGRLAATTTPRCTTST